MSNQHPFGVQFQPVGEMDPVVIPLDKVRCVRGQGDQTFVTLHEHIGAGQRTLWLIQLDMPRDRVLDALRIEDAERRPASDRSIANAAIEAANTIAGLLNSSDVADDKDRRVIEALLDAIESREVKA